MPMAIETIIIEISASTSNAPTLFKEFTPFDIFYLVQLKPLITTTAGVVHILYVKDFI